MQIILQTIGQLERHDWVVQRVWILDWVKQNVEKNICLIKLFPFRCLTSDSLWQLLKLACFY